MKKNRVLVVDDDRSFARVLNRILSGAGYKTFITSDTKNIFEMVRKVIPDIILLDVLMPEASGFDVKSKLNKNPSTASIPVVFLTVKDEIPDKVKGFHLGADDYVNKPFNPEELLARIDAILHKKSFYEKISMTDGLTGLYNIKFFKRQFPLFFNTAQRYNKVFSLTVIDINGLKCINDTRGHMAGDFVLNRFALMLKKTLRKSDLIMRYGGDEFVVIMPETNNKQAAIAVKRLKNKIKVKEFIFQATKPKLTFTISAGIATYKAGLKDESQMFELADQKLYKDKRKYKKRRR